MGTDGDDRQPMVWCIVVGGGSGSRYGQAKQYLDLAGERVIDRSVSTAAALCAGVVVVVPAADLDREGRIHAGHGTPCDVRVVAGGPTRADSVRAGLLAVPTAAGVILVHDAARPLATAALYRRVMDAVLAGAAAVVPAVRPVDTLRSLDATLVDRESTRAVQTPQGFRAEVLRRAHSSGGDSTDDATLAEAVGHAVTIVEGERSNLKITEPLDLVVAAALLSVGASALEEQG